MSYKIFITGMSDAHIRSKNQDRIYPSLADNITSSLTPKIFAIADGMGGEKDGEKAAQMAVEALSLFEDPLDLKRSFLEYADSLPSLLKDDFLQFNDIPTEELFELFIHHLNRKIISESPQVGTMGTTLSMLYLQEDSFFVGHLGDSRIYRFSNRRLERLTLDDNLLRAHLDEGAIPFIPEQLPLSKDDRHFLEKKHLLKKSFLFVEKEKISSLEEVNFRSLQGFLYDNMKKYYEEGGIVVVEKQGSGLAYVLGGELPKNIIEIQRRLWPIDTHFQTGDLFLLASDGLTDVVSDERIEERLLQITPQLERDDFDDSMLMQGMQLLFEDAVASGSKDNISLILLFIGEKVPSKDEKKETNSMPPSVLPEQEQENLSSPSVLSEKKESSSQKNLENKEERIVSFPSEMLWRERFFWLLIITLLIIGVASSQIYIAKTLHQGKTKVSSISSQFSQKSKSSIGSQGVRKDNIHLQRSSLNRTAFSSRASVHKVLFLQTFSNNELTRLFPNQLRLLSLLSAQYAYFKFYWKLKPSLLFALENILLDENLSYSNLLELSRKQPFDRNYITPFQVALKKAVFHYLFVLVPHLEEELSNIWEQPSMPKGTMSWGQDSKLYAVVRRNMVLQLVKSARDAKIRSWLFPLLQELLVEHEKFLEARKLSDVFSLSQHRRRCVVFLEKSLKLLIREEPTSRFLLLLRARIQAHRTFKMGIANPK